MIIIASDKFKGSLTSLQVGEAVRAGIHQHAPSSEVLIFPMADGGDGFDEVMNHYFSLEKMETASVDALMRPINGHWRWDAKSKTAYIAVSAASALVQLKEEERNPEKTSSYGSGLLIKDAIAKGAVKIVLGLGGSATNDAGMGILAVLGFLLLNENGEKIEPVGGRLTEIKKIIAPDPKPDVVFNIACDVDNPLFGKNGAAYVYGPQKGADEAMVKRLDDGLRAVSTLLSNDFGKDISQMPSLGAAGGIAAGLLPYFNIKISSGIDLILEASDLLKYMDRAELIITGEGKLDEQSIQGKVVGKIAALARQHQIKSVAVCGVNELDEEAIQNVGLSRVVAIRDLAKSDEDSVENANRLLQQAAKSLLT
ncbi:MAG: glycerate kinase [Chitinophagaceae bacterium]|nr:glycerate kinase [Chitinophagaceae bacterium]